MVTASGTGTRERASRRPRVRQKRVAGRAPGAVSPFTCDPAVPTSLLKSWAERDLPPGHPVAALVRELPPSIDRMELLTRAGEWSRLLRILDRRNIG